MIGYIRLKNDNKIIAIVADVVDVNTTDIIGANEFAKGSDTNLVDLIVLDSAHTKNVNLDIVPIECGDELILNKNEINRSRYLQILSELFELDKIITRQVEQMLADANITPTYQAMVTAITSKQALRLELSQL